MELIYTWKVSTLKQNPAALRTQSNIEGLYKYTGLLRPRLTLEVRKTLSTLDLRDLSVFLTVM